MKKLIYLSIYLSIMIGLSACKTQNRRIFNELNLPRTGSTIIPPINAVNTQTFVEKMGSGSQAQLKSDASKTVPKINHDEIRKLLEEFSSQVERPYVAAFAVWDTVMNQFKYGYATLDFDPNFLSSTTEKELIIIAQGNADSLTSAMAIGLIPKTQDALNVYLDWLYPEVLSYGMGPKKKINDSEIQSDCIEWRTYVVARSGFVSAADDSKFTLILEPQYELRCVKYAINEIVDSTEEQVNAGNPYEDLSAGSGFPITDEEESAILEKTFAQLPCDGDPVANPQIAPQKVSGVSGGRKGPNRKYQNGSPKCHNGLDIKALPGQPIYAMYDGKITYVNPTVEMTMDDNGNLRGGELGYFVNLEFQKDGETYLITYAHLAKDGRPLSDSIKAGQRIGYQGLSGNLEGAVNDGDSDPHVHISIKKKVNGRYRPLNCDTAENPEDFLSTKFDAAGRVMNNPCQN